MRAIILLIVAVAAAGIAASTSAWSQATTMPAEKAREENAYAIGLQAYLWGYPLHYYSRTEPKSIEVGGAYINDFRRYTELKTAADKFVVTPNK